MFPMIPFRNDIGTCYSWSDKGGWLRCETHVMSRLTEPANLREVAEMEKLLLDRFGIKVRVLAKVPSRATEARRDAMFERNKPTR